MLVYTPIVNLADNRVRYRFPPANQIFGEIPSIGLADDRQKFIGTTDNCYIAHTELYWHDKSLSGH